MSKNQYWTTTLIAAVCFVLMLVNIALGYTNAAARAEVAQRQQFVQQSIQLEGLYKEIVRSLAELGARNNDADVKALLQRHGITYNVNPPAAPASAGAKK
jgi:hypothetical protein